MPWLSGRKTHAIRMYTRNGGGENFDLHGDAVYHSSSSFISSLILVIGLVLSINSATQAAYTKLYTCIMIITIPP